MARPAPRSASSAARRADSAATPPSSRSQRHARADRAPGAPRGGFSKLDGLVIGGGAVAGVALLAVLMLGGSSGSASGPGAGGTAPPSRAAADRSGEPAPAIPERSEADKKRDVRLEYLRNSATIQSAAGHMQLADWCEKAGLAEESKRELARAALKDPDGRDGRIANEKLGRKRYEAPIDLNVRELAPYLGRYLTAEEVAEADAIVAAARERARIVAEEEAKDPWLKNARAVARTNLLDPAMKNFNLTVSYHRPYVVFVESDAPLPSGGMLATGEAIAVKDLSPALQAVHEEHGRALAANLENYVAKYGHLIHNYEPETDVFLFFSFKDRKSFEAYQVHRDPRAKPESFVRAYYIPKTREVISYLRETEGGPTSTPVHVVCHEAIHQLTHHFLKGSVRGKDDPPIPGAYWFQEGFAEYLSPASEKPVKDPMTGKETYDFGGILRMRLVEYASNKANGIVLPVDKLIRNDQSQAVSDLFETMKNSTLPNEQKKQIASVGFYGQAWFFTHFLNHYADGKYKEAFEKHLANELNAASRPVDFIRFLGIQKWDEKEKFDKLQEEMDAYLDELKKKL